MIATHNGYSKNLRGIDIDLLNIGVLGQTFPILIELAAIEDGIGILGLYGNYHIHVVTQKRFSFLHP